MEYAVMSWVWDQLDEFGLVQGADVQVPFVHWQPRWYCICISHCRFYLQLLIGLGLYSVHCLLHQRKHGLLWLGWGLPHQPLDLYREGGLSISSSCSISSWETSVGNCCNCDEPAVSGSMLYKWGLLWWWTKLACHRSWYVRLLKVICIESYALCIAKSTSLCTSDDDIDTLLVLDGAVFQAEASKGSSSGGSGGDKSW